MSPSPGLLLSSQLLALGAPGATRLGENLCGVCHFFSGLGLSTRLSGPPMSLAAQQAGHRTGT